MKLATAIFKLAIANFLLAEGIFLTLYIMKEFFRIMAKDYMREDFSKKEWLVYGVVVPCAMIAGCLIASYIETL